MSEAAPGVTVARMTQSTGLQFAKDAARVAQEHNAENITVMDLRGMSPVCDFFVVCSGTSDRHRRTIADMIAEHGRSIGEKPLTRSGYDAATWVLLDFVDVVIHVFAEEYREYYDLELLWGDAPRIDWAAESEPRP